MDDLFQVLTENLMNSSIEGPRYHLLRAPISLGRWGFSFFEDGEL
jgi:hypothetical protein